MSLELLEKNFNQAKESIGKYNTLIQEKKEIENKTDNLKLSYEKGEYGRDIFSEHNKRLMEISNEIERIKRNLNVISGSIKKEAEEEIKNVKQY